MVKKIKTALIIYYGLFLLILTIKSASAEIELKPERILITDEESLATLFDYQETNESDEQIITVNRNAEGENICYLHKLLHIDANSTFRFEGKDCKELRLYPGANIRIEGTAYFMNIKVTSADKLTNQPIQISRITYKRPRPHIYTYNFADYVHIENSEFSYLGSYSDVGSTWGVSFWHLKSGFIDNSKFHHNYFGIYTWETKDLVIQNSSFHDNLEYGMDFHDYSDNFTVRNNTVYNNGNHGIIFSKFCDNNKIVNNYIYDHTLKAFVKGITRSYGSHGIMLHENSNNNFISNNVFKNNHRAIFIDHSDNNFIEENIIISDRADGIYLSESVGNVLENNVVLETGEYGLYSYYSKDNEYSGNYFEKGSYFKDEFNGQEQSLASAKHYLPPGGLLLAMPEEVSANPVNPIIEGDSNVYSDADSNAGSNVGSSKAGILKDAGNSDKSLFTNILDYKQYHFLTDLVGYRIDFGKENKESEGNKKSSAENAEKNVQQDGFPETTEKTETTETTEPGRLTNFSDFIDYKRYHILAIVALAVIVFVTDLTYKKFKNK